MNRRHRVDHRGDIFFYERTRHLGCGHLQRFFGRFGQPQSQRYRHQRHHGGRGAPAQNGRPQGLHTPRNGCSIMHALVTLQPRRLAVELQLLGGLGMTLEPLLHSRAFGGRQVAVGIAHQPEFIVIIID